jgi:hypothetical protein
MLIKGPLLNRSGLFYWPHPTFALLEAKNLKLRTKVSEIKVPAWSGDFEFSSILN